MLLPTVNLTSSGPPWANTPGAPARTSRAGATSTKNSPFLVCMVTYPLGGSRPLFPRSLWFHGSRRSDPEAEGAAGERRRPRQAAGEVEAEELRRASSVPLGRHITRSP